MRDAAALLRDVRSTGKGRELDVLRNWQDRRENPWKDVYYDALRLWRGERGHTLLHDYMDLPEGGTVFDFGGNEGKWADMVLNQQPDCTIHLFEPHPRKAASLRNKYRDDDRVKVYDYALGSAEAKLPLPEASISGVETTVDVVSVRRYFDTFDFPQIDLVKLNIGGAEYDLIPALSRAGILQNINRLQVTFHLKGESQIADRDDIRAGLSASHDCAWCYPFIWEEWRRR